MAVVGHRVETDVDLPEELEIEVPLTVTGKFDAIGLDAVHPQHIAGALPMTAFVRKDQEPRPRCLAEHPRPQA